jgi:hypothetical protein
MNKKKEEAKPIEVSIQEDLNIEENLQTLHLPVASTPTQIIDATTQSLGIEVPQNEKESLQEKVEVIKKYGFKKVEFSLMDIFKIVIERAPNEIIIKHTKEK